MGTRSNPRIAFVGAGAIGGYVGGHLTKAGLDVVLIDQWAAHVEAMQRDGRPPFCGLPANGAENRKARDLSFSAASLPATETALVPREITEEGASGAESQRDNPKRQGNVSHEGAVLGAEGLCCRRQN